MREISPRRNSAPQAVAGYPAFIMAQAMCKNHESHSDTHLCNRCPEARVGLKMTGDGSSLSAS